MGICMRCLLWVWFMLMAGLGLLGCLDYLPLGEDWTEGQPITLEGSLRIELPAVGTPVWVIFAIDCSRSMSESDPAAIEGGPARIRAIEHLLDSLAYRPEMRFGVVRFGGDSYILSQRDHDGDGWPEVFLLPDGLELRESLAGLEVAQGWTAITDAMDLTRRALDGELWREDPVSLATLRVQVILLTDDGNQNGDSISDNELQALLIQVEDLVELTTTHGLDRVQLHTVQLSEIDATAGL